MVFVIEIANEQRRTTYAHLFDPKILFEKLKNDGQLNDTESVRLNDDTVEIKLTYREAIHPDKELELISGSWNARDLVGSQVHFANLNGFDLEQSTYIPIASLRIFTPTLAFKDFDATLEVMQERSFIADPFTLEGKKIQLPDAFKITLQKTAQLALWLSQETLILSFLMRFRGF